MADCHLLEAIGPSCSGSAAAAQGPRVASARLEDAEIEADYRSR